MKLSPLSLSPPQIGLDDKTGVAIALRAVERLLRARGAAAARAAQPPPVHVLFTFGEEAGQKGAIAAPLPRLLGGRVRHALVIDRQTRGAGCPRGPGGEPVRHVVSMYKGVPLLDAPSGGEMLERLRVAFGAERAVPHVESPNCADALEYRGRWDAEVAARAVLAAEAAAAAGGAAARREGEGGAGDAGAHSTKTHTAEGARVTTVATASVATAAPPDHDRPDADAPESAAARVAALARAVRVYDEATAAVRARMAEIAPEERVSGMNQAPRIDRYRAMSEVHDALAPFVAARPELQFSCVNLSYDYDDGEPCALAELEETTEIVMKFIEGTT